MIVNLKKNKNKGVFKYQNDKGEVVKAQFSDDYEEEEKLINDTSDGPIMYCGKFQKEMESNDYCKSCDRKVQKFMKKDKKC